jgi:ell wall binding domain 2 (CWB2)
LIVTLSLRKSPIQVAGALGLAGLVGTAALTGGFSGPSTASPYGAPPPVTQFSGADRVSTGIMAGQQAFPTTGQAGAVVLARDDFYADALGGSALAVTKRAPLYITPPAGLDPRVATEIQRVLATGKTVYVLGGDAALDPSIDTQLTTMGYVPQRVFGPTRFDTAVAIAGVLGDPASIIEATGFDFPDGLCGGASAGKLGGAVLLTGGSSQAPATANYLAAHPSDTRYALGGPAAAADPTAQPLVGSDRYATCVLAAQKFFSAPVSVGLATGEQFPDALVGGAHIGALGGPLLLTQTASLPTATDTYLKNVAASVSNVYVYGGPSAVNAAVVAQITADA